MTIQLEEVPNKQKNWEHATYLTNHQEDARMEENAYLCISAVTVAHQTITTRWDAPFHRDFLLVKAPDSTEQPNRGTITYHILYE